MDGQNWPSKCPSGNSQYHVHIDGSNWVTQHNCHSSQEINPVVNIPNYSTPKGCPPDTRYIRWPNRVWTPTSTTQQWTTPVGADQYAELQPTCAQPKSLENGSGIHRWFGADGNSHNDGGWWKSTRKNQPPPNQSQCRSTRTSWSPWTLSPQMRGASHEYSRLSLQWTITQMPYGPMRGCIYSRAGSHIIWRGICKNNTSNPHTKWNKLAMWKAWHMYAQQG